MRARLSKEGRDFVLKALHPADDRESGGIPDQNQTDLYRTTFRQSVQLNPPVADVGEPNVDWLIWCPPGDNTMCIVAVGVQGTDFRSAQLATAAGLPPLGQVQAYVYSFSNNTLDQAFRGSLASGLNYTVVASPGDTPALSVVQWPPWRVFATSCTSLQPLAWRTTASSITINLTSASLYNQGTVYAWSGGRDFSEMLGYATNKRLTTFASQPLQTAFNPPTPDYPFGTDDVYEVVHFLCTAVPFHEEDMTFMDPDPFVARAVHGVYIPHKLLGPTQPLQNHDDYPDIIDQPVGNPPDMIQTMPHYAIDVDPSNGFAPSFCVVPLNRCMPGDNVVVPSSTGLTIPPWLHDKATGYNLVSGHPWYQFDSSMDNVAQSVTIFRGLAYQSSLSVKRILALEAEPLPYSVSRPFVRPALLYEPNALTVYYKIASRLPNVHIAKDNDFGDILRKIAGIAQGIIPVATGVIGDMFPDAKEIIGPVGELAGKLLSRIPAKQPQRLKNNPSLIVKRDVR